MPDEPVCPKARKVEGATPISGGVICEVLERDAKLADGIMEGAVTSPFLRWAEDPSMLRDLCYGAGEPLTDPDAMKGRPMGLGHYSGCPIYAASVEAAEMQAEWERVFKPKDRPTTAVQAGARAPEVGEERITDQDIKVFGATEGPNAGEQ